MSDQILSGAFLETQMLQLFLFLQYKLAFRRRKHRESEPEARLFGGTPAVRTARFDDQFVIHASPERRLSIRIGDLCSRIDSRPVKIDASHNYLVIVRSFHPRPSKYRARR